MQVVVGEVCVGFKDCFQIGNVIVVNCFRQIGYDGVKEVSVIMFCVCLILCVVVLDCIGGVIIGCFVLFEYVNFESGYFGG